MFVQQPWLTSEIVSVWSHNLLDAKAKRIASRIIYVYILQHSYSPVKLRSTRINPIIKYVRKSAKITVISQ